MGITVSRMVKIVVSLFSIAALSVLFLGAVLPVLNAVKNGSDLPARYIYFYSFPFVYWPYCIVSCTKVLKGNALVLSGVAIHLALALWVLAGGTLFVLTVGLFFTGLWSLLCVVRITTEKQNKELFHR